MLAHGYGVDGPPAAVALGDGRVVKDGRGESAGTAAAAAERVDAARDPTPFGFQQLVFDEEAAGRVDDHAPTGAAVFAADPAGYRTPTGEPFLPPLIGGQDSVALLRAFAAHGDHLALSGPPGSGKTTLAQVAHPDLVVQSFHGETTVEDVVGR